MISRGFSLIELIVTLAVLAVLAALTFPMAELSVQRSKEQELAYSLRVIREAIDKYKEASDEGRISKSVEESGYPRTLYELLDGVVDAKDPQRKKIYFLRSLPTDPTLDIVDSNKSWGLRSYKSSADNPESGPDVFDVYSLSEETGLNGISYSQW